MAQIKKQLIVFDFDWSLADQDTDRWIFEVLAPDLRREMKDENGAIKKNKEVQDWTSLVIKYLGKLQTRLQQTLPAGQTPSDSIKDALRVMPFHPAMVRGVKYLKKAESPKTTFFCLSNSNQVFIDTILEKQGLSDLFDEIVTNKASVTNEGLIHLRPRIDSETGGVPHSCQVGCNPNMCKGDELKEFLRKREERGDTFDRVIYVGDGSNDYCPVLRLRTQDLVLCRRFRGLEGRLENEGRVGQPGSIVKCGVMKWAGAWEVEEIFKQKL